MPNRWNLSGLTIKNKQNINGDIEIVFTGLRPGEKLCEELLIDSKSEKTQHPLIFRASEKYISLDLLLPKLDNLYNCLVHQNEEESLNIFKEIVPEWQQFKKNKISNLS